MTKGELAGKQAAALLAQTVPRGFFVVLVAAGPGERVQVLGNVPKDKTAAFLRETADSIDEVWKASENPTPPGDSPADSPG